MIKDMPNDSCAYISAFDFLEGTEIVGQLPNTA